MNTSKQKQCSVIVTLLSWAILFIFTACTEKDLNIDSNVNSEKLTQQVNIAKENDEDELDTLIRQSIESYENNNYEQARDLFDKVLEIDPHNLDALVGRAQTYNRLGALIELNPYEATLTAYRQVHRKLGATYLFELADYNQALVHYDKGIEVLPQSKQTTIAMFGRGLTHWLLGNYKLAIVDLQKAYTLSSLTGDGGTLIEEQKIITYMLCRISALSKHPPDEFALTMCDAAVDSYFQVEGRIAYDARAIIRILSGDYAGATRDLETFLAWAHNNEVDEELITQREQWIANLTGGENSLDPTMLEQITIQAIEQFEPSYRILLE